jgi:hypothetical protein
MRLCKQKRLAASIYMNGNGNSGGSRGGQLVSQLMEEINSGTGNNDNAAYNDRDYYPQNQHGEMEMHSEQQQQQQNFNPDDMVPPPREDDIEDESDNDNDSDSDDEEYYYKENNLTDALSQFGGEYTSFIMDLLKNSVIIFIGYIIFSHPFTHNYIMQFAAMVPGLQEILAVPTYYLAVNGLLFVIFYFIVSYFI